MIIVESFVNSNGLFQTRLGVIKSGVGKGGIVGE
jgi:hypothetical protein